MGPSRAGRDMLRPIASALAIVFTGWGTIAAAAPGAAAIEACVRDNLTRYDVPDRAVAAQYVDLEQACIAALSDPDGTTIRVTPIRSAPAPGAPAAGDTASGVTAPTSSEPAPAGARPARDARGREVQARVRIATPLVERPVSEPVVSLGGVPAWGLGLAALLGAAAVGVAGVRLRRTGGDGGDGRGDGDDL